jgi:DNA-binding LacI/PurR family transcriptional regulator
MQRWFAESGLPAALSGSCHPGIVLPSVDFDYRAICRHAVGQFLRRGHRRIALLMPDGETAGDRESAAGFMEGFGSRGGASAVSQIVHHDGTPDGIRRQLHPLFQSSQPPTALLVARSMPALMAASELMRRGLRVPQDVALIARDSDYFHEYFSPQLARYRADPDVHARRLARILMKLVRGETGRPACVRLMPDFLPGESLGETQHSHQ